MEVGAHVWLRSKNSRWGWVPAQIKKKEEITVGSMRVINVTLINDILIDDIFISNDDLNQSASTKSSYWDRGLSRHNECTYSSYYSEQDTFEVVVTVDPEQLKTADHDDIKLRNLSPSYQIHNNDSTAGPQVSSQVVVGGVDDLIGLTHLHEPAILHALRLRYDADIIYTATGPILIAINPFKPMKLYTPKVMEQYRLQGEKFGGSSLISLSTLETPFKRRTNDVIMRKLNIGNTRNRLPPHAYQTADDAYRAMIRGLENVILMNEVRHRHDSGEYPFTPKTDINTNQSILVSGDSGAGKTVTTKIVLNYLAMLSEKVTERFLSSNIPLSPSHSSSLDEDISIEQQVLQSNPILESFGNARTIRNDNSSRFGKYIDIQFASNGKLTGASIDTYLLEKVRLIHPSERERNYHVFYQFLTSATPVEREQFYLDDLVARDFRLLAQTGTFDRRDGVSDASNHQDMLTAMITIGFHLETIQSLMRLIVSLLFAGNMSFTCYSDDSCTLDENHASLAVGSLLGVNFDDLAAAITSRTINTVHDTIEKKLSFEEAMKASEALIKAIYGAMFDFIVKKVNESIGESTDNVEESNMTASIGVLDIFGFEIFDVNNFEQLCINYANEALQQQFNKYVFKLEQMEYDNEGILWKYIAFPDNQDVLDLIDKKHVGILAILDEQCIVPRSTDERFTRYLYSKFDMEKRFSASYSQRVDHKFSIVHYAGNVEYSTVGWLEKNKDQLPAKSSELLLNSTFKLLTSIHKYIRSEDRNGRRSLATKSVAFQFSAQLRTLRDRIDSTTPHYIRCLKPNDELIANYFEPKNIVEQLRCGGVLEAVRVSRAGFPTRYPHEVFTARYYILGDKCNNVNRSGQGPFISRVSKEEKLKKLISDISYKVWEADRQLLIGLKEAESVQSKMASPQYRIQKTNSTTTYIARSTSLNVPTSLAIQSSIDSQRVKNNILKDMKHKTKMNRPSHSSTILEWSEQSQSIANPESEKEYMNLDFVSRCAVSGLQLGRTKVFLRREAFDRIEAMRSQKFFISAVAIQSLIRLKIYRSKFLRICTALITIQSNIRMFLSAKCVRVMCLTFAVIRVQNVWRMISSRRRVNVMLWRRHVAAILIQRYYREKVYINHHTVFAYKAISKIQSIARGLYWRNRYYSSLFVIIRVQAIYRGQYVRTNILNAITMSNRNQFIAKNVGKSTLDNFNTQLSSPQKNTELFPLTNNSMMDCGSNDLYKYIHEENWARVESILDRSPELVGEIEPSNGELLLHVICRHSNVWTLLIDMVLVLYPKALIHRDNMGALPIHHAAAHDNLAALEIIYSAYKEGINEVDMKGRLPLHLASEFDALLAVKYLLSKAPEGAFTMIYRPVSGGGGGLPLHVACRSYTSIGVITALLAGNFASAKRCDENGDLPLHLILRGGDIVDQVTVKTLITCFSEAASRTDMNGDLPLLIALKHKCKPSVVNCIMMQYPNAAKILNSKGKSPLFIAFQNNADDRTILGLLNHAPTLATYVDKGTGFIPIQIATQNDHSHFIVHNLLKRDMPISLKEKVRARLLPHHYSWNHIVAKTDDRYYQVVSKILQQCTQPQVLALAHVEGPSGKIALAESTPVCKHELRVMLRLFNTLEVVNQRPAYSNSSSDTQIFYALRYDPPETQSASFTTVHDDIKDQSLNDYIEDWDDVSVTSAFSKQSLRSSISNKSHLSIEEKLRVIKKEQGQQVIAKLTSRSDIVERELKVRKNYHLSRHYVPAIISVHHTVQHAAYSEAMAEPGYCITMEGADTTAENLMLDMRRENKPFPVKALKRIGISLLHMHEHGLVHCDFGTHNIGKFGTRWKLLGVGGSVPIGQPTDPNRGFYHPPESIVLANKRTPLGKKAVDACVLSIPANTTYDIWAYGVVLYEATTGIPLLPYSCRGKRAMTSSEISKIGNWDNQSLNKVLKHVNVEYKHAKDLIHALLHHRPEQRISSMRAVLEHPFFGNLKNSLVKSVSITKNESMSSTLTEPHKCVGSIVQSFSNGASYDDENTENGVFRHCTNSSTNIRESKLSRKICNVQGEDTYKASDSTSKTKKFGIIHNKVRQ